MKKLAILSALMILLFSAAATAQPQFEGMSPFTKTELTRFIQDWPAFVSWADERGEAYGDKENGYIWSSQVTRWLDQHGWQPERMFYVAYRCATGMASILLDEQAPEVEAGMAEAQMAIMNNPSLSAAQREQMLAMFRQSQSSYQQARELDTTIPPQEMALIRHYSEQIRTAMELNDER
ncbi:MAG: hypothetical protein C0614_12125 [Desulfuromonas sp.]|nr:MAG: hypothetical protein C0614_12125 [Desulfuromonas sp.]